MPNGALVAAVRSRTVGCICRRMLRELLDFFSQTRHATLRLVVRHLMIATKNVRHVYRFGILTIRANALSDYCALTLLQTTRLGVTDHTPTAFRLHITALHADTANAMTLSGVRGDGTTLFLCSSPQIRLLVISSHRIRPFSRRTTASRTNIRAGHLGLLVINRHHD